MVENDSTEYKEKLTAGLEKEVVAFLNARGGTILSVLTETETPSEWKSAMPFSWKSKTA